MDSQALQQIKDIIQQQEQIFIVVGRNPHIDDMAAALSLYLTFQAAGKKVVMAAATQPLVEHSSLVGIDKVQTSLQTTGGDFIVSFPYQEEGEIEKVSYTLENGLLNIIVKPGEQGLSFSEKNVRYTHGGGVNGLLFTVGISRLSDISGILPPESLKDTTIINIDNKEQNENYGNVVLVSPRFSSVSEQVADLLLSLGYEFDIDTAQNLLYGISVSTNNFQNLTTSYLAFEIAAILLRKGAKRPARQQQERQMGQQNRQGQQRPQQFNQQHSRQQSGQGQQRPQQQQNLTQQNKPQQVHTSVAQSTGQSQSQPEQTVPEDITPPADWLTPKVYKGSTNL